MKKDNERDVASIYSSADRNTTILLLRPRLLLSEPFILTPPFDRFDSYALLWTFLGFLFLVIGLVWPVFFIKGKGSREYFFSSSILVLIPIIRLFPFSHCRIFFRFIFPFCVHFFIQGRSFGWCSDLRLFFDISISPSAVCTA
ncbi:hypothetical protein DFP73DRAFT_106828 [Morchella snyderi]|nr:hypothetical protein DFP73DRAFT_106828 [Morchella snyderi]